MIKAKPVVGNIDNYIDKLQNGFQSNCTKILNNSLKIKEAFPSASSIGLLASFFSKDWLIEKPYDLVPDYIAPFEIKSRA